MYGSWISNTQPELKVLTKPEVQTNLDGCPCSHQRTWAENDGRSPGRSPSNASSPGVKAFEEFIFGPRTLVRTWGTHRDLLDLRCVVVVAQTAKERCTCPPRPISQKGCRPLSDLRLRTESRPAGVPASASWHRLDRYGRVLRRTLAPCPRGECSSRRNRRRFADSSFLRLILSAHLVCNRCSSTRAHFCARTIPAQRCRSHRGSRIPCRGTWLSGDCSDRRS